MRAAAARLALVSPWPVACSGDYRASGQIGGLHVQGPADFQEIQLPHCSDF